MIAGKRARPVTIVAALLAALLLLAGCARTIDGQAVRIGAADDQQSGHVDTDQFERLLLECDVLPPEAIAEAVGGGFPRREFVGAICRWRVAGTGGPTMVTLNWFEWGTLAAERRAAEAAGYETENVKLGAQTGFLQRDPERPAVCGATAKAPGRGIYSVWVEPSGSVADPCAAPTELIELLLQGGL